MIDPCQTTANKLHVKLSTPIIIFSKGKEINNLVVSYKNTSGQAAIHQKQCVYCQILQVVSADGRPLQTQLKFESQSSARSIENNNFLQGKGREMNWLFIVVLGPVPERTDKLSSG